MLGTYIPLIKLRRSSSFRSSGAAEARTMAETSKSSVRNFITKMKIVSIPVSSSNKRTARSTYAKLYTY